MLGVMSPSPMVVEVMKQKQNASKNDLKERKFTISKKTIPQYYFENIFVDYFDKDFQSWLYVPLLVDGEETSAAGKEDSKYAEKDICP